MTMSRRTRRGVALLAVLWMIVAMTVVTLGAARVAHRSVALVQGEHDRVVGRWVAEGCVERVRALLNEPMQEADARAALVWRDADRLVASDASGMLAGCELAMRMGGRVVLSRATREALDTLPGMSSEAVARILVRQAEEPPIKDLLEIEGTLSAPAKALMDAHYAELLRATTLEPDAWIVRSQAHIRRSSDIPVRPVNVEARLVRAATRAAVVRWVEW